tara:strand:- start:275 stop:958 length:684 start_codon:yes stop_codon:yes gene_type:complete
MSGETIFIDMDGNLDMNVYLPNARAGLNYTIVNKNISAGTGNLTINALASDTMKVISTAPQAVANTETIKLTFGAAIVTGNTISMSIMGQTITTAFTTNSDTTMAEFAASIQAVSQVSTAVVTQVASATNNDRIIYISAADTFVGNTLKVHSPVVTGGSSQAIIQVTTERAASTWTGLTHVNNQAADYIQIDTDVSPGGEWIELISDGTYWYAKITSISAEGITPAG